MSTGSAQQICNKLDQSDMTNMNQVLLRQKKETKNLHMKAKKKKMSCSQKKKKKDDVEIQ